MAGFTDFLSSIGSGLSKAGSFIAEDFEENDGGFKKYLASLAQGVTDKTTGVSPQQRFQMEAQKRDEANQMAQQAYEMEKDAKDRELLYGFRDQQIDLGKQRVDASLTAAEIRHQDELSRQAAAVARETARGETRATERAEDRANELSDHARNERENDEDTLAAERREQEDQIADEERKAQAKSRLFPGSLSDFPMLDETDDPIPGRYDVKAYDAAVREWDLSHRGNEGGGGRELTGFEDNPELQRQFSESIANEEHPEDRKTREMLNHADEAASPNASEEEAVQADVDKNSVFADFERETARQQEAITDGTASFSGAGSTSKGDENTAAQPALLERQEDPEANRQERARDEIAGFREIVEAAAAGDADAAKQLGRITDDPRVWDELEIELGPELRGEMRKIYFEIFKAQPPF